jgi:hypothetical protein
LCVTPDTLSPGEDVIVLTRLLDALSSESGSMNKETTDVA